MKIIWVLVNCNSFKEADQIGGLVLKNRLASCFDVLPRLITRYFWPPTVGKIMSGKGCLLILETFSRNFKELEKLIRKYHSDKLPFIGSLAINNIHPKYMAWMKGELKK